MGSAGVKAKPPEVKLHRSRPDWGSPRLLCRFSLGGGEAAWKEDAEKQQDHICGVSFSLHDIFKLGYSQPVIVLSIWALFALVLYCFGGCIGFLYIEYIGSHTIQWPLFSSVLEKSLWMPSNWNQKMRVKIKTECYSKNLFSRKLQKMLHVLLVFMFFSGPSRHQA